MSFSTLLCCVDYLVEGHELRGSVLFGLVKRLEADLCRRFCCKCEWTWDCVQIMGPNSHQASLPALKKSSWQLTDFSISHFYNLNICTSDLQMFWWSFSCSSMKLSYRSCVKVIFLNTAATAYGRTAAVCAKTNKNCCLVSNLVICLILKTMKLLASLVIISLCGSPLTGLTRL